LFEHINSFTGYDDSFSSISFHNLLIDIVTVAKQEDLFVKGKFGLDTLYDRLIIPLLDGVSLDWVHYSECYDILATQIQNLSRKLKSYLEVYLFLIVTASAD
jgi:hypothetical protein